VRFEAVLQAMLPDLGHAQALNVFIRGRVHERAIRVCTKLAFRFGVSLAWRLKCLVYCLNTSVRLGFRILGVASQPTEQHGGVEAFYRDRSSSPSWRRLPLLPATCRSLLLSQ
jgi:hypothetical protein